jgi:hypothetical protein
MSRDIDLTRPLSEADRQYLVDRCRWSDIEEADGVSVAPPANVFGATDPTPEQNAASVVEEVDEEVAYDEMTVADLKAELDARKEDAVDDDERAALAYGSKENKEDLIKRLEAHDEAGDE